MRLMTRYTILRMAVPFVAMALTITGLVWTVRALRMLDLVIVNGQSGWTYFSLLVLALPSVLDAALPVALFAAALYTLHRLFVDNEIATMFTSGLSRLAIMRPALLFAGAVALVVLVNALYGVPWGRRTLKLRVFEIRADIASAMLQPGAFVNPADGITIFVRRHDVEGQIRGLLLQDARRADAPVFYLAESGALVRTKEGARLVMYNGNIQYYDRTRASEGLVSLSFDKYAYDLSQLISDTGGLEPGRKELYPYELLAPAADVSPYERMRRFILFHTRVSSALYPLAYVMLALAALLPARFNRRGYMVRIITCAGAALALRLTGFAAVGSAIKTPDLLPIVYIVPLSAIVFSTAIIIAPRRISRAHA